MTKKVLPVVIGMVLAGGVTAAAADVALFGHIDTSLDAIDIEGGYDDIRMSCTTCSIGFKGSEDLGNGLKAIFSIDFEYDTVNRHKVDPTYSFFTTTPSGAGYSTLVDTTGAITDRDQWVGLAGGFGKVRIGTISTGYKSHGAMIDPLYRTALQGRDRGLQSRYHSGAGEELQGRATNTIRWDSPDWNGVKLVAHYTVDSHETWPVMEDDNPWGLGASYGNDGLLVFADYMDNAQSGIGKKKAWKVGGKYDMGMFGVMGQYEDYQNSNTDKEKIWHVAGTVSLLGVTGYLGYGKGDDDLTNNEYTAWTLAAMYDFSKNTMLYFGASEIDCDLPGGLSACSTVGIGGGEDDKISLGLKHRF